MAQFSLGKQERIKSKILMTRLFEEGKSYFKHPFSIKYLLLDKLDTTHKFAVSVPKRNFKHAVDRNLIKRQLREVYRHHKSLLPHEYLELHEKTLILIIVYIDKHKNDNGQLQKAMKKTLSDLALQIQTQ